MTNSAEDSLPPIESERERGGKDRRIESRQASSRRRPVWKEEGQLWDYFFNIRDPRMGKYGEKKERKKLGQDRLKETT